MKYTVTSKKRNKNNIFFNLWTKGNYQRTTSSASVLLQTFYFEINHCTPPYGLTSGWAGGPAYFSLSLLLPTGLLLSGPVLTADFGSLSLAPRDLT